MEIYFIMSSIRLWESVQPILILQLLACATSKPLTSIQFQKIFVINLPSRTDHRDSMSLAAALTDLRIDYVDGVIGVDEESLPPGGKEAENLGSWRAHMNIARM